MELIGAHQILGLLGDHPVLRRQQLRTHRRVKNVIKDILQFFVAAGIRVIPYQMADQRLGNRCIHPVHGHMVSVVGGPAQCQFRHISRTNDQCIFLVCDVHQHLRAFPGLPVFIGNIMAFHILPDIGKMSGHRFSDIHFPQGYTQSLRQQAGIFIRPVRCSEAGHGHCYNSFSGKLQQVKGTYRH